MATLSPPSPLKAEAPTLPALVPIPHTDWAAAREALKYSDNADLNRYPSVGACCGCAILTRDWHWQETTEKYADAFDVMDGFKSLAEAERLIPGKLNHDLHKMTFGEEWWKKLMVVKDKTYLLYTKGHSHEEVIARAYSPAFLAEYEVKGATFEKPGFMFSVVWAEKKQEDAPPLHQAIGTGTTTQYNGVLHGFYLIRLSETQIVTQPQYKTVRGYYTAPTVVLKSGTQMNTVAAIQHRLETSGDMIAFTYNKDQASRFDNGLIKKFGEHRIVLRTPLVRNPNYSGHGPRVATIIFKGDK